MAVKGNDSAEKTVKEKALYTGLAPCKILTVNPNKSELSKMGINFDNEPTYISNKEGRNQLRFDFWVAAQLNEGNNPVGKLSLWLTEEIFVGAQKGKTQFINKYGKTGWGMSASECGEYFLADGARPAYKGEEDLHKLLSAFLNTVFDTKNKKYDDCVIDSPKALFGGNYTEINNIINSYKNNTVRLLWGVDSNGYQTIYSKYFEKTCVNPNYTNWNKVLDSQYGGFKADFQSEFTFQAYIQQAKATQTKPDAEKPTSDVF